MTKRVVKKQSHKTFVIRCTTDKIHFLWFLSLNMGYYFFFSARNSFPKVKICSVIPCYSTIQATARTFMFKKRCWHSRSNAPGKRMEVNDMFQSVGIGFSSADTKCHLPWPRRADVAQDLRGTIWDALVSPLAEFRCKFNSTDLTSTDN